MKKIVFFAIALIASLATYAQIDISLSVGIAPPALPVYSQPECPNDGYLWCPGYWGYGPDGYYWVPGVWVAPPNPGLLWTPSYWGFEGGNYRWHAGYWGEHVGFYGGINYGFGYGGRGYGGGRWEGNSFRYNTAVVNVNTTVVRNTYVDRTVINNTVVNNHTSFNGQGGVEARPTPQEQQVSHEQHTKPTPEQNSHHAEAAQNRSQLATVNNGHPATAAMKTVNSKPAVQQQKEEAKPAQERENAQPKQTQQVRTAEKPEEHQMKQEKVENAQAAKPRPEHIAQKPAAQPKPKVSAPHHEASREKKD